MQTNFKIVISYHGHNLYGVIPQPGLPTVGGYLKRCLESCGWRQFNLFFSSRTDAGVHAIENLVQLVLKGVEGSRSVDLLNLFLPPTIRIKSLSADAHFQAITPEALKSYKYYILPKASEDVGPLSSFILLWQEALDFTAMHAAAPCFIGQWDFSFFQSGEGNLKNKQTVRKVTYAQLRLSTLEREFPLYFPGGDSRDLFVFETTAHGFMRHMVRYMVGALLNIGQSRSTQEQLQQALAEGPHYRGGVVGFCAPPQGLWLVGKLSS